MTTTTTTQNETVVRAFIDRLFSEGDLGAVAEYLAPDFVNHDPPFGTTPDRDGMAAAATIARTGCPDWHSEAHRYICDGDFVVEHFTASGTHRGDLIGVAPTGRTIALKGMHMFRLRDGLIVERWGQVDELGVLAQLGLVDIP
jgi:predicted ester cyclase